MFGRSLSTPCKQPYSHHIIYKFIFFMNYYRMNMRVRYLGSLAKRLQTPSLRNTALVLIASFATLTVVITGLGNYVYAQFASSTLTTGAEATSTPPVSITFGIGDRVYPTDDVKVRSKPDIDLKAIGTQASGTPATVISEPVFANDFIWWNLDYESGVDGWSVEDYLKKIATSSPLADVGYSPVGEQKLTNLLAERKNPQMQGNRVVWEDYRSGTSSIYAYDLDSYSERRLELSESPKTDPSVYGNRVVYVDRRPDTSNPEHDAVQIYQYDFYSHRERPLNPDSNVQSQPAIYADTVAYVEKTVSGQRSIVLFNIGSNTKEVVASSPSISGLNFAGNYLAWMESAGKTWKVFAYDLTAKTRSTFGVSGDQVDPAVLSDGKVVFADRRYGSGPNDWEIFLKNVATSEEKRISSVPAGRPTGLSISGNLVAWSRDGDVYVYDLNTKTETKLTSALGNQEQATVNEGRVVWIDGRSEIGTDLYLLNLK